MIRRRAILLERIICITILKVLLEHMVLDSQGFRLGFRRLGFPGFQDSKDSQGCRRCHLGSRRLGSQDSQDSQGIKTLCGQSYL